MTLALCFACGEKKFGSFNLCNACGREPSEPDNLATSLLLSDRFYSEEQLERYGNRIKQGMRITAPERFRRAISTDSPGGLTHNQPKKSRWYGIALKWWGLSLLWSVLMQTRRQRQALEVLEQVRAGKTVDFCLYLRPFRFDQRSFYKTSERRLAFLVERRMPLLSLAGPESSLGAARIVTEDERWREDFLLLASNAVAIFTQDPRDPQLIPTPLDESEGIAHEFQTLSNLRLTGRLVFLLRGGSISCGEGVALPDHWTNPSSRNFCEIAGSGIGLRPLTGRSIREILDSFADYREIEPPLLDRFVHVLCGSFVDHWNRPEFIKHSAVNKRIDEVLEYASSPEARTAARREQRRQALLICTVSILGLIFLQFCSGDH